ncbi:hypothetical protein [Streptomyces sp. NPDC015125]
MLRDTIQPFPGSSEIFSDALKALGCEAKQEGREEREEREGKPLKA